MKLEIKEWGRMCTIKKDLRDRARNIRGLATALTYDVDYLFSDIKNYDLLCLGESLHETKITLQQLVDSVTELEYQLYLIKREDGSVK